MNKIFSVRRASPVTEPANAPHEAEAARLQVLDGYQILNSAPEKSYDDIARLAAFICGAAGAVIAFLDHDRQWIKARFGNPGICQQDQEFLGCGPCGEIARRHPGLTVIPDATLDARLQDPGHRLKLRFYAAVTLVASNGVVLGMLAVMDPRVRHLTPAQSSALETLGRQVMELLEMRRTVIGLSDANARLGQQTVTDALTAVPNRRAYDHKILEEFSRARRNLTPLAMLLVDIDHFKQFNDSFGHPAGDAALRAVARSLQAGLRPYDFLARYGGEEFAIILPTTGLDDAVLVAERVRLLVAVTEFPYARLSISIGVAQLETDLKTLVLAADRGLYQAKASGRNRVEVGRVDEFMPQAAGGSYACVSHG